MNEREKAVKMADKQLIEGYESQGEFFDEVFDGGKPRDGYGGVLGYFSSISPEAFKAHNEYGKVSFFNQGITFAVYSDSGRGVERIFPFDLFPRLIDKEEWEKVDAGVRQRNRAINAFLYDIYHDRKILKEGLVPEDLVDSSAYYVKEMIGLEPPGGVYVHIAGTDLIRHSDGEIYVLEDNVRSPSGVSYVLSNRVAMKRTFSKLFFEYEVAPVHDYGQQLLATMKSVAPKGVHDPVCVVLTPGSYNSAYFEHSFLARIMGVELVEGRDLFVEKEFVYMKTIDGPKRVDVIYRRIDDDFLDPECFNPESMLGVSGVMAAYREGNVTLVNAPGTGVADDKAVYIYLPEMIRYYLGEEPILNNVPTWRCGIEEERNHVLANLDTLVVKPVDESGGYGLFIGTKAEPGEKEAVTKRILENPRKYIAQPIMSLSVHPTYIEEEQRFEPRHLDLRTFSLTGDDREYVLKGGLTRVALKRGSLVVNSSQGGGSKDTWVVE